MKVPADLSDEEVVGWIRSPSGPSAAVYEAGPTGYGLARAFTTTTTGIRCEIAAPSRTQRRDRLEVAMAADSELTPVVHRLGCLRGVSTLTAFGLAVEVGDWDRLTGASIGLTPVTVCRLLAGPGTRTA